MNNSITVTTFYSLWFGGGRVQCFLTALPASLFITVGLIWGMERLIRSDGHTKPPEVTVYNVPNPVLIPRTVTPLQITKPQMPDKIELPPAQPLTRLIVEPNITIGVDPIPYERVTAPTTVSHFSANVPIPTAMVQPNYPALALAKGYEGYVDVQFDVTPMGSTENVKAIAARPEKIFDRAAEQAVKRWKFSPVTIDGTPQKFSGMVKRIVFELQD